MSSIGQWGCEVGVAWAQAGRKGTHRTARSRGGGGPTEYIYAEDFSIAFP